jgi:F-type H+-transporting ATPase subunit b
VLIDWFTVCAQALNFLILVWLLRRYLYRPVLAAIDAREKKVTARIKDAETQETKAQASSEELRKRNEAFDHERDGLMRKTAEDCTAERQRIIETARQDAALLRVKMTQSLASERAELGRQLSVRAQAEVFALTRKALSELAGVGLEDRMMDVLIERLRAIPDEQKQRLVSATFGSGAAGTVAQTAPAGVVLVRSAHDPSPAARTKLETAIRECLGENIGIRFETVPELVSGLELSADGIKLPWSVADYLSTLAQDAATLASELTPDSSAPSVPAPEEAAHAH